MGDSAQSRGLYLHIPFCRSKCRYCSFVSQPAPGGDAIEEYIGALITELSLLDTGGGLDTLYLGGGTPSILPAGLAESLFAAIRAKHRLKANPEITVEANPGTLDRNKAEALRSFGVNRVSLGVQSFNDRVLRRLGRRHDGDDTRRAFGILRGAGFENIGIDLIYGLPDQGPADWERDLESALDLKPEHFSLYALSVEENTPFAEERRGGSLALPQDEDVVAMYRFSQRRLEEAGFEQYEISNWCRPGFASRHNWSCWTMQDYFGCGAGAHSFQKYPLPVRFWNLVDFKAYIDVLEKESSPVDRREELSSKVLAGETIMLGMRLLEGIDRRAFRRSFGADAADLFPEAFGHGLRQGWVEERDNRLRLTSEGLLFADEIFCHLFD